MVQYIDVRFAQKYEKDTLFKIGKQTFVLGCDSFVSSDW